MRNDETPEGDTPRQKAISIHSSVWRETSLDWLLDMPGAISIHSLRVEGDSFASPQKYEMRIFQSTPSVWRETGVSTDTGLQGIISIHSLRVEGDQDAPQCITAPYLFQSTPSVWRETFVAMFIPPVDFQFQSTPSVWRETLFHHQGRRVDSISIHSLRVEGDKKLFALDKCNLISIHSLRVEGDFAERISNDIKDISIHSLRVEGDDLRFFNIPPLPPFQSTPSVWRETLMH